MTGTVASWSVQYGIGKDACPQYLDLRCSSGNASISGGLPAPHEAEYLYLAGDIGHIHSANILPMEEVLYCNNGDWVKSCTALIELTSGELQIVD